VHLGRYAGVISPGTGGPVAVTTIYYPSFEAVVAKKLLGNLADTDLDGTLEPCVLQGACDGRQPTVEPARGRRRSPGANAGRELGDPAHPG
jgi:hypothetical protein